MSVTEKTLIGTTDCTPTWPEALRQCLVLLTDGSESGKALARAELERMAKLAEMAKAMPTLLDAARAFIEPHDGAADQFLIDAYTEEVARPIINARTAVERAVELMR